MVRASRVHLASVAIFIAVSAAAWAALYRLDYGKPTVQSRWVHALYEDKTRIAQAIAGPKIVVVGGSSVLFGVRADMLSKALAVPVVNFGTHAGLDLDYLLHRSTAALRPGDMVLLCIEYEMYNGEALQMSEVLLDYALARDPAYLGTLPARVQLDSAMMLSWSRALEPWRGERLPPVMPFNPYFAPRHLDANGDTLGNATVLRWDGWRGRLAKLEPIHFYPSPSKFERLAAYVRWCRERGIAVVGVSPPMLNDAAYATPDFAGRFALVGDWYRAQAVPLLLRPADAFQPVEVFFDTRYHLDSAAASAYTARVAERLAPEVARWKARAAATHSAPSGPSVEDAGDFPLARLVQAFEGWEPLSGSAGFEGPYPQWGLGPVTWLVGSEAHFRIRSNGEGAKRLDASVRATASGQVLSIAVAGREVARCTLPGPEEFTDISAELGDARPFDDLVLREEGARPDASERTTLLKAMRVIPSGGAKPAHPACRDAGASPR
jgi:hypothetical protein